ncbi:MAG: B12-binding domain-containing radical SAM protein [Acutalibacteraceae bacterium]
MKKVYFIQANMFYGKALYLPYAVGCLAAYAWQFESIKQNYEIGDFLYKRDPIDETVKNIKDPGVVALSCYTWTFEYNKKLAEEIKKLYPDCFIIFGGHNVSENQPILEELNYVDALIYGEGECPFKEMLEALPNGDSFYEINNIAFRDNDKIIVTPKKEYDSVENYLSPYLEGYFDPIVEANPDTEFCAVLETNRGCPYHCAYCDWCYSVKIRQFPMEKIKKEIVWCSQNRIEYIFCADGNFGIFERDYEIAQYVAEIKKQNGYPHIFNTCFAKNSNETVLKISKLFYKYKLNKAATLAYQTVNETALKNVNRKNFTMEDFASLVKKYNENHIPTYTEMILGLPGETYDSFCDGLCKLMEAGQQSALTVYYCQVYCNSIMGTKEYQNKHQIKTARVPLNYLHSTIPEDDDIVEYTNLVVGTKDMPFEDLVKSIIFCTCLQCFHHIGLLKFFAVYSRYELGMNYRAFYDALLDYIFKAEGTFINSFFVKLKKECSDFSGGEWSYYDERFGEIGWFLEEGVFMEMIYNYELFWEEIMPFLKSLNIDKDVFEELVKFQKFAIRLPNQETISEEFEYDFITYFDNAITNYEPLKKRRNVIKVKLPNPVYDWKSYAKEVMLFAKRRGDTIVTNDKRNVEVDYRED